MAHKNSRSASVTSGTLKALVFIAFIGLVPNVASVACPARCRSCANGEADCARRSLTAPPKIYPEDVRIINLEGNHLRVLGSRSFKSNDAVEVLKISGNKLASLRNDAFGPFPNLMTLDLTGNRIYRIYKRALRNMGRLRTLSLNRNRIRSLSRIFSGVPNLYQLNLAKNRITTIGENDLTRLTRLHYLDLRDNKITTIHSRAFKNVEHLRYLFLNNNPIVSLPPLEFGSSVLQLVDLSHCKLTSVPGPFPSSVTDLRLGHNKLVQVNHTDFLNITDLQLLALNDNELHFLADGTLTHLSDLKEVWLRGNNLVYIPRDLPNSVRKLHMDSNNIQEIEAGLFTNQSRLDFLTVENNQINSIQPNTFRGMRFLNTLNFQGNRMQNLEANTFVDLGSLSTILLSNNPLRRIEAGAFRNLGNLTQLFLSYIVEENFELEGNFLPEMLRLQMLHLMNSPGLADDLMAMIDDPAATSVRLDSLTQLDLSYNTLEWISPRIREVFPNINSLPLDGNPLRCHRNLQWLRDWMITSDVSFHNYEEVICESPSRLNGRPIRSIQDSEWGRDNEMDVGGSSTLRGYQGDVGGGGVAGRSGTFAVAPEDNLLTARLRASRAGLNKRSNDKKRRGRGKGRGRKGKKGERKNRGEKKKRGRKNRKGKGKSRRKRLAEGFRVISDEEAKAMGM